MWAARLVGGRPVLPFIATFCQYPYPCYTNGSVALEPWAVQMLLTMPYERGAAGVVVYVEKEAQLIPQALAAQLKRTSTS